MKYLLVTVAGRRAIGVQTYLAIVLEPLRGNLRDGVVFMVVSSGDAAESSSGALTHGGYENRVDVLREVGGFL